MFSRTSYLFISRQFKPSKAFLCVSCEEIQTSNVHGLKYVLCTCLETIKFCSGDFNYTNENFLLEFSTTQLKPSSVSYIPEILSIEMKPSRVSFRYISTTQMNSCSVSFLSFNYTIDTVNCFILEILSIEMKLSSVSFRSIPTTLTRAAFHSRDCTYRNETVKCFILEIETTEMKPSSV